MQFVVRSNSPSLGEHSSMVQVSYVVLKATDEETSHQQIGHLIREARLQADLTQKELAQKLGVSVSTVNKYETNGQKIPIYTLAKIARVFRIDLIVGFQT